MNTDSLLCLQPELKVGSLGEDFQILQRLLHEESVALWVASDGLDTIRRQSFNSQEELGYPQSYWPLVVQPEGIHTQPAWRFIAISVGPRSFNLRIYFNGGEESVCVLRNRPAWIKCQCF